MLCLKAAFVLQVTAITYKKGITVLDIHSTQMLGAYGFLARVFAEFEKHKLSVDVLASSEVSVSLTLDKKQNNNEIKNLIDDLTDCADITRKDNMSILTLIADVKCWPLCSEFLRRRRSVSKCFHKEPPR